MNKRIRDEEDGIGFSGLVESPMEHYRRAANRLAEIKAEEIGRQQGRLEAKAEIELLRKQRDAWKAEAEYQYGLVRFLRYGEEADYPVTNALDAYVAGKYPVLKYEADKYKDSRVNSCPSGKCSHSGHDCIGSGCIVPNG